MRVVDPILNARPSNALPTFILKDISRRALKILPALVRVVQRMSVARASQQEIYQMFLYGPFPTKIFLEAAATAHIKVRLAVAEAAFIVDPRSAAEAVVSIKVRLAVAEAAFIVDPRSAAEAVVSIKVHLAVAEAAFIVDPRSAAEAVVSIKDEEYLVCYMEIIFLYNNVTFKYKNNFVRYCDCYDFLCIYRNVSCSESY